MTAAAAVRERPILFSAEMVRAILAETKTQTRRVVTKENSEFGAWGAQFWKFADLSRAYVDGQGSGSEYLHVPANDSPECIAAGFEGVVDRLRPRMAPAFAWDQAMDGEDGYVPPAARLWVRESWNIGRPAITSGVNSGMGFVPKLSLTGGTMTVTEYRDAHDNYKLAYAASWDGADVPPWRPSIHMPRWASRITLEITNVRVERLQAITNKDAIAEGCLGGPHVEGFSEGNPADPYEEYASLWDALNEKRAPWSSNPWVWVIEFARVTA